jgi:ABC-type transport system involved in multi-copper enzyme maturation permease subunit
MNNIFAIANVVLKEMYRRKDFYVLLILTVLITVLLGLINIFNDDKTVRYMKEICLLLIWISTLVIAITTAARQIPAERESRTIFPLLAKPVSRNQMIVGKFVGCWIACAIALVAFYSAFAVLSGAREHVWPVVPYFQAVFFHWIFLGVVIAMVLLGSLVFTAVSSNATICFIIIIGILLLGGHLNQLAGRMSGISGTITSVIYFAIPHLEFYDLRDWITHNRGVVAWVPWLLATAYGLIYSAIFLGFACLAFRRKALSL